MKKYRFLKTRKSLCDKLSFLQSFWTIFVRKEIYDQAAIIYHQIVLNFHLVFLCETCKIR